FFIGPPTTMRVPPGAVEPEANSMNRLFALVALGSIVSAGPVVAGDWPQFRGSNGAGGAHATGLPPPRAKTENIRWKTETPGRSVSSPIVFGNKLYLTSASGVRFDKLHIVCLDADTGKQLWRRDLTATGNTGHHPKSSMAAPSPCADADG